MAKEYAFSSKNQYQLAATTNKSYKNDGISIVSAVFVTLSGIHL